MDLYLSVDAFKSFVDNIPCPPWKIVGVAAGSVALYQVSKLFKTLFILPQRSLLKDLPGPTKGDSFVFGHMGAVIGQDPNPFLDRLHDKYGHVFQIRGPLRVRQLVLYDPKAISHVVNRPYEFPKPENALRDFRAFLGAGLAHHGRQRKILGPCFGNPQVRDHIPIYYEKAEQLRDVWLQKLEEAGGTETLDIFDWTTRTTLDILGTAGFNTNFHGLDSEEETELMKLFDDVFRPFDKTPVLYALQDRWPILHLIPTVRLKGMIQATQTLQRMSADLLKDRASGKITPGHKGKDLLSVMIKANDTGKSADSRFSDEELLGQVGTMLFAGHETTADATAWALWELAKPEHRGILKKLRDEVSKYPGDQPDMEKLNTLPYLDAFIKENMRLNSPVDIVMRSAGSDAVIPLSRPYVDRYGVKHSELKIGKDEPIMLPLMTIDTSKEIWGDDAREFKPERWLKPDGSTAAAASPRSTELPGVWASQMSFHGGPRSCLGQRTSVMEMKVILFVLVRQFDFALPTRGPEIVRKPNIVARPAIKLADGTWKNALPLVVKQLAT